MRFQKLFILTTLLSAACITAPHAQAQQAGDEPIKIYLLFGQSNMNGQGRWYEDDLTTTVSALTDPSDPLALTQDQIDAFNTPRDDAWIDYASKSRGPDALQPGYGSDVDQIGIELSMGHTLGDASTNPLYFIKSGAGGTSLAVDWRTPSAVSARGGEVGATYTQAMGHTFEALANFEKRHPEYNGVGFEIAGVVWLQGLEDIATPSHLDEYQQNMVDFANDIRDALSISDLPVIIADSPRNPNSDTHTLLATAKENAASALNAELANSAAYVDGLGVDTGSNNHWLGRATNYIEMGNRIGSASSNLARRSAVNHDDGRFEDAWDGHRDTYRRVAWYQADEPGGTGAINSAGSASISDAVLSSASARTATGLAPGSSSSLDANLGVIRATHDFGTNATNFTFAAWIQLDSDLPDELSRFVILSGEDHEDTSADTSWNFGVERKQVDGQWVNTLFADLNGYNENALGDSTARPDIVLEEGQSYFVAFVLDQDLTAEGELESPENSVFYFYDPANETLLANDGGDGTRQKAISINNTRVGIGISSATIEDPDSQFHGLIDDAQVWDLSLDEEDLMKLAQFGSLSNPVPEPTSGLLIGLGLLALHHRGYRNARSKCIGAML